MTLWIALGLLAGLLAVQTIRAWWYHRAWKKLLRIYQDCYMENVQLKQALGCKPADDYWPAEIE